MRKWCLRVWGSKIANVIDSVLKFALCDERNWRLLGAGKTYIYHRTVEFVSVEPISAVNSINADRESSWRLLVQEKNFLRGYQYQPAIQGRNSKLYSSCRNILRVSSNTVDHMWDFSYKVFTSIRHISGSSSVQKRTHCALNFFMSMGRSSRNERKNINQNVKLASLHRNHV